MRRSHTKNIVLVFSFLILLCFPTLLLPLRAAAGAALGGERELFSEAERRYFSKRYGVALELYEEFLGDFPLSTQVPDVQYRRAVCLFRLNRFEEARSAFEAVEKRYRATRYIGYVPFWQGVIAYQVGDHGTAREKLDTFLLVSKDPELRPQALLYKALSEISTGMVGEARSTAAVLAGEKGEKALSPYETVLYSYLLLKDGSLGDLLAFQDRTDPVGLPDAFREKALLYRAEALWGLGEFDRAVEVYRTLLGAEPPVASAAYRRLYSAAQRKGDFSEMERIIQGAEDKFAGSPAVLKDLWLSIGIESYRRGDLDLSRYFLEKVWNATEAQGDSGDLVPIYLSEMALKRGDFESAARVLEEYLERSADAPAGGESTRALLRLGAVYLRAGRYADSSARLQQVLLKEKDRKIRDEALYLLAYAQYKSGDFENSLNNLNKVIGMSEDRSLKGGALRLKALALKKLGRPGEAARTLEEYLTLNPDDGRAALDLVKLKFDAKDLPGVLSAAAELLGRNPALGEKEPRTYLLVRYIEGLSAVGVKSYAKAFESFEAVSREKAARASLDTINPFARYYSAWAQYRMNNLEKAARGFSEFLQAYPSHELGPEAQFMEGWCLYSLGDYEKARGYFARTASGGSSSGVALTQKARFLQGKSLVNLKKLDEAGNVFSRLFRESPGSAYADDALFEYAGILEARGKTGEAASSYLELADRYPDSPLAPEALYKRGEVYLDKKAYTEAKSAFNAYRSRFPKGKLVDAALYWEGHSAFETGEKRESVLLWGILVEAYPRSSFRPDALLKEASAREDLGEYREALDLLGRLTREFPEYARAVGADVTAEKIRYQIFGLSEREAELTALISKGGGVRTRDGRKAMIDLARIYLPGDSSRLERAFQMLSQVSEQEDPVTGGEAQFLLGEYYWRRSDWEKAGREFVKASLRNPEDRDFVAYSILRSAQAMKRAGKDREVQELVKRLQEGFAGSQWADEGKKLLEGAR
jgi:TolA-binding protein